MKIWLDNGLCNASSARVSVFDHGFLYGDGVYETLRVRRGEPLLLEEHLARLRKSCRLIHLELPWSATALKASIRKTLAANRLPEAALRIQVSRGPGPVGFDVKGCRPTLVIFERPLKVFPSSYYEHGVTAALVRIRRNHPDCLPPGAKSTNCLNGILAKWEADRRGAFEGILLNLTGHVTEGTVSNVFMVKKGKVLTPPLSCGLLAGVTRAFVIRLARKLGLEVREAKLGVRDLLSSDEVFLTSSLFDIMPVTRLFIPATRKEPASPKKVASRIGDRRRVGDGRVGPITRLLMERYRQSFF